MIENDEGFFSLFHTCLSLQPRPLHQLVIHSLHATLSVLPLQSGVLWDVWENRNWCFCMKELYSSCCQLYWWRGAVEALGLKHVVTDTVIEFSAFICLILFLVFIFVCPLLSLFFYIYIIHILLSHYLRLSMCTFVLDQ